MVGGFDDGSVGMPDLDGSEFGSLGRRAQIDDLAAYALDRAELYVSDPVYLKWKGPPPRLPGDTDSLAEMMRQCRETPPTLDELQRQWEDQHTDGATGAAHALHGEPSGDVEFDTAGPLDVFGSFSPDLVLRPEMLPQRLSRFVFARRGRTQLPNDPRQRCGSRSFARHA